MGESKFPYKSMPIRLDIKSKKITTELCFFADISHADKYIKRYGLTKREYKLSKPRKKKNESD
jgi:hypothetical protein